MKKRNISNRTIALIAAAVLLFAGGTFTGTRAVLNVFSPEHFLEFETDSQFVQIEEVQSDNSVVTSNLLTSLDGKVTPGKVYDEKIRARNNTTDAPQFVRIIVRKYWKDADGNKVHSYDGETVTAPDPALIKLDLDSSLWQKNSEESTVEREVYYYKNSVGIGEVTENLTKSISVDNSVAENPKMTEENGVITYTYDYDGYQVCLEAEAQSIQTHNASDAVRSIWGVTNVTVSGDTLTVNKAN